METRKTKLGADHPSTLTSMANLVSTCRNQGRCEEAEKLEVQVMKKRKRVLGAEHPSTLTSMANLASTYRNQGRWKEAERLEELRTVHILINGVWCLKCCDLDYVISVFNIENSCIEISPYDFEKCFFFPVAVIKE
jgi:hypothetical protein